MARDNIEIVEEFRFLFNLYYNSQSKEYVDLENDTSVVKISDDNLVSIHKRYLKSYLAIKNMALIIHIDSRCTDIVEDIFPTDSFDYRNDDNTVFYTVNIGRGHNGIQEENFSILFGKKVLFGCKLKDCNIWPYNEKKQYIEFIVGVDDNGRERSSGTGHRKGKSYQKISKVFDIQKENYTETFSNILESATLFLNYISTHIEELSK